MSTWAVQHILMTEYKGHLLYLFCGSDFLYLVFRSVWNITWYGFGFWLYYHSVLTVPLFVGLPFVLAWTFRMAGVFLVVFCCFTPSSPLDIRVQRRYGIGRDFPTQTFPGKTLQLPAWGIGRVLRHSQFLALLLVAFSCLMHNVYLSDLLFWSPHVFAVVVGIPYQERRMRANPELQHYLAQTSSLPNLGAFRAMSSAEKRSVGLASIPALVVVLVMSYVPFLFDFFCCFLPHVTWIIVFLVGVTLFDNVTGALCKWQYLPSDFPLE
eukprot:gb/GEZN01010686.1/.p1 GENE.gb/GEZN01010686.1/~~gb/GEZN01010686.1/.p1  ORF type:complete len:280 (-),score=21.61 gb/GEZN01010686.1/:378-1178(-)